MALKLFNTLSKSIEDFVPLDASGKKVGLYCCGPTVHNLAHIGNFRTFVAADLLRRHLQFKGFDVQHVMNITDVEDKIIAAVRAQGETLTAYTQRYEQAFLEDFKALNCLPPQQMPHATDYIADIIRLIELLMERGIAYQARDGSIFFSIDRYRDQGGKYGQLVKLNFEEMRAGERVSSDDYGKESFADFALWKAYVPEDGAVSWESPWGRGRPGWHIECSAMSMKLLGVSFDLHMGGEDLIFPHHEDEIAQSEGAGLQPGGELFVKYWVHVAHLLVEGKKMAKSLGNFFTLRDLIQKGFSGREIRYLLLSAHYRESFNFTLDGLHSARAALARIDELLLKVRELAPAGPAGAEDEIVARFAEALDDDLNISAALGAIFEWVRQKNKQLSDNALTAEGAARILGAWEKINSVLGLTLLSSGGEAPAEIQALLEQRQAARKSKNFARADQIRDELKANGWVIEDTPRGPRLKKVS